jgi:hypothetical protein
MAKRGQGKFERNARDLYKTPRKALLGLLPHLPKHDFTFIEPCAADGRLAQFIMNEAPQSDCYFKTDIHPLSSDVAKCDIHKLVEEYADYCRGADMFITNPPFVWEIAEYILRELPKIRPTWLLIPLDWLANVRMAEHLEHCHKVVPVGRVKWIEGSKHSSAENFAFFLFDQSREGNCQVVPRAA